MGSDSDSEWEDDPTLVARKRRMFARSSKGGRDDEGSDPPNKRRKFFPGDDDEDQQPCEALSSPSSSSTLADLSALPGVKKQSRYEPELPDEQLAQLSKEELSEWRKRARKVRNRESAAASRLKTRERINELESEVEGLKKKYQEALARIKALTSQSKIVGAAAETPQIVSPPASVSPELSSVARSPPVSPRHESWALNGEHELYSQDFVVDPMDHHYHHLQHVIAISRPTAVCV
jgi:bZIP transcription factor